MCKASSGTQRTEPAPQVGAAAHAVALSGEDASAQVWDTGLDPGLRVTGPRRRVEAVGFFAATLGPGFGDGTDHLLPGSVFPDRKSSGSGTRLWAPDRKSTRLNSSH